MAQVVPIPRKAKRTDRPKLVHQFLVVLTGTNPLVWRRIQVPGKYSFWDLHVAIQDAMGWQDCHLHEFRITHPRRGTAERLGIPDPEFPDERPCTADWDVLLSEYFNWDTAPAAPSASYMYDLGDDWHHLVMLEQLVPRGAARLPRCVDGARACPPEDCGGVGGFNDFVRAIADPRHPEHAAMMQWSGGAYNPEKFDPAQVAFDRPRRRWVKAFG